MAQTLTTTHKIILAGFLFIGVILGGGFWFANAEAKARLYVEAAAECERGRGGAMIDALDKMYGRDARPSRLRMTFIECW